MTNFQDKANFIWQVADDILRGSFKESEYGEVTLPFVVLRRLDCVLESTKDTVIETNDKFKDTDIDTKPILLKSSGQNFYNTSFYDLFRVHGGKLVEHWDTTEAIPPRSEWKNNNGKF